jgi:hypothetical protein
MKEGFVMPDEVKRVVDQLRRNAMLLSMIWKILLLESLKMT